MISLGQLYDDDCKVILDKKELNVYKDEQVLLKGYCNSKDGLWDIPITTDTISSNFEIPPTHPGMYSNRVKRRLPSNNTAPTIKYNKMKPNKLHSAAHSFPSINLQQLLNEYKEKDHQVNVIIKQKQSKQDLARYLHAACFSPTKVTFTAAISNNNFSSWPGLTAKLINNHLPKSLFTYQGHMHKERQGLQSTKIAKTALTLAETLQDLFPTSETPNLKMYNVCYALLNP